jgi:hypothetical protein
LGVPDVGKVLGGNPDCLLESVPKPMLRCNEGGWVISASASHNPGLFF